MAFGRGLPDWTQTPIYAAVRVCTAALGVFPIEQNLRTFRTIGGLYGRLPFNRDRLSRAVSNIAWCFPDWSRERVEQCALDAYRRLFALAIEMISTPRLLTEDGWPMRVRIGPAQEAVARLVQRERTIFITGHCGNWEVLGYTLAVLGFHLNALYRPLDLRPLDRWVRETRERRGLSLIDKFGAGEVMPGLMEKGEPVSFLADQNAGERGVYVPFFGRLASTYKSIGLLALRYDAPIVCGCGRAISPGLGGHFVLDENNPPLNAQGFRYELDVVDVIHPHEWADQPDPLFYVTARYRRALELMVRRAPEQYLWMHRYWKTRPAFERAGKPIPERMIDRLRSLPWMTEDELARIVERGERDAAEARTGVVDSGGQPLPARETAAAGAALGLP